MKDLPVKKARARENIYGADKKIRFKIGDVIDDFVLIQQLEDRAPSAIDTFDTTNSRYVRNSFPDTTGLDKPLLEKKKENPSKSKVKK